MSEAKPKGSGYYAALVGLLGLAAFGVSFTVTIDQWTREWLVRVWLLFISATLLLWGSNRIRTGREDWTVGQDTINLVNGLITSTIALVALLFGK